MSEKLSMRKYAEHRGVTVEAVSKAVKTGRISCERDERGYALIDPAVADQEWAANTDLAKFRTSGPHPHLNKTEEESDEKEAPKENPFQKSATVLKTYQARLAKLEFDEKAGKLHDVDECKKNRYKVARLIRDSVMNISDRLSPELAGETDQFEIKRILDTELRKVLENLKADIEALDVTSGE